METHNVVTELGLVPGNQPTGTNAAKLQVGIDDPTQLFPFQFPAGRYDFEKPIFTDRTSRTFLGNGIHRPSQADAWFGTLGPASRLIYRGLMLTFNGTTTTATTQGLSTVVFDGTPTATTSASNGTVLTITGGHAATATDTRRVLIITGGTNFRVGTYNIISTGSGTWTLNRDCRSNTSIAASGLLGTAPEAAITMTGVTATASHVGATLILGTLTHAAGGGTTGYSAGTGGTNFTVGTYVVTAIIAPNIWVLDRGCATAAGSGMLGRASHDLWQDQGFGTTLNGLYLTGRIPSSWTGGAYDTTGRAAVLVHQLPNPSIYGLPSFNTGKLYLEGCTLTDAEVGVLYGRDLCQSWSFSNTFTGDADPHADNSAAYRIWMGGLRVGFYLRTTQSVKHTFNKIIGFNVGDLFYVERGGQIDATNVEITGGNLLRVGRTNANGGQIRISDFGVDADPGGNSFKLLAMDGNQTRSGTIILENGIIDQGAGSYPVPIIEVRGGMKVIVRNVRRLLPGSILCVSGPTGNDRPHVIVEGCSLQVVSSQNELRNGSSSGNYTITFRDNSNSTNSVIYPDHTITNP